ncbi:MAG: hypothetical protein ACLFWG_01520 [Longimicrobiales bacterium]
MKSAPFVPLASILLAVVGSPMLFAPAAAQVPTDRPLRPVPGGDREVVPFMEGWYENDDGSVTISYGYWNLNQEEVVEIPVGEDNFMVPEEFGGMQPETFYPGRQHGVFGMTLPGDRAEEDVWWHIVNANGKENNVPGRARAEAYQLDRNPRPHGSVAPQMWFDEGEPGSGPEGVAAEGTLDATVGDPITVEVRVADPSEHDLEDPRLRDGVPVRVVWYKHQGPGTVEFTHHETMPEPEEARTGFMVQGMQTAERGPRVVTLEEGEGPVRVYATFDEPGEYMLRARADNWAANDSNALDQCCWSNAYVRVSVRE